MRGDGSGLAGVDDVGQDVLCEVEGGSLPLRLPKAVTRMSAPSSSRMLSRDVGGDEFEDVVGDVLVVGLGLLVQDGQTGLELRRVDLR